MRYEERLKDSQRVKGNGEANGGDDGNRTHDLLLAKQALYQLSYVPVFTARSGYREKTKRQDKSPAFRGGGRVPLIYGKRPDLCIPNHALTPP